MKIAAAQTIPQDGNTEANIIDHCRLAGLAADNGAQLIVFPEMSLTGYQRKDARLFAFAENDARLCTLRDLAISRNITIIAGAPIEINTALHIGAFIIRPDKTITIYTKQFLHAGEEEFFAPGFDHDPKIQMGAETISLAICADIANPIHPANAAITGCTLYVAGIFYTPGGIATGHEHLAAYARQHSMNILMANYGGPSWSMDAGGKSAFWNNKGELIGETNVAGEGLLIAELLDNRWNCSIINTR